MKNTKSNEIKAAIFLVIAATIMVGLSLRVSGTLNLLTRQTYNVLARFEEVIGIEPMAKVTLNGVRVGRVRDIRLIQGDPQNAKAELVLELDQNKAILYPDATAMITSETLLAMKHIDLHAGTPQSAILENGSIIYGRPAVNMDKIMERAETVIASLEGLLTDKDFIDSVRGIFTEANTLVIELKGLANTAQALLEENREKVGSVVDNFEVTSKNLIHFSERLTETIDSLQADFHQVTTSTDSLINENRPEIRKAISRLSTLSESLTDQLDPLLEDTHKLVNQLNQLTENSGDDIQLLLREVEQTAGI